MQNVIKPRSALISVSDKTDLESVCRVLQKSGVNILSTGGTHRHLTEVLKISATKVEDLTKFPEMLDGRVKTLHPKVFGGILARRENKEDAQALAEAEIPWIDLVIVNLYPFDKNLSQPSSQQVSFVDIGGPAMLRAAAKCHESVAVLSDIADYGEFLSEWAGHEGTTLENRKRWAAKTFARTSAYDAMIATEWGQSNFPNQIILLPTTPLRYGENPHQTAVWAGTPAWKIHQGKELSYNNILDAEAAVRLVSDFENPCVAIIKHGNPCGVAAAVARDGLSTIFQRALASDRKSSFGGVVAVNQEVDELTAQAMSPLFLEVVIAPAFSPGALNIFAQKKNLRLVEWKNPRPSPFEVRSALGGWLIQQTDFGAPIEMKVVTKKIPSPSMLEDLKFAWKVCRHVRSNAIVIAGEQQTSGVGAGQMSRIDSVEIAIQKAKPQAARTQVMASDAFFPFRDNIDAIANSGVRVEAIIQPGGSLRDAEVIQACDEHGIAMVFTRVRHFRH